MSGSSSNPLLDFGAAVWRADQISHSTGATVASGHPALDAELPGGGWPVGAISEILQAQSGLHEWRLLLPALRSGACGPVVLVGAPHAPFGPGLRAQGLATHRLLWINTATPVARLWSAEQALRCAEVAAVLLWLPQARPEQLRRLQIAAAEYAKLLFVMRPAQAQSEASPAVLRLLVCNPPATGGARADALQVQLLKRRGPPLEQALVLPARCAQLAALLALSGAGDVLDRLAAAA